MADGWRMEENPDGLFCVCVCVCVQPIRTNDSAMFFFVLGSNGEDTFFLHYSWFSLK